MTKTVCPSCGKSFHVPPRAAQRIVLIGCTKSKRKEGVWAAQNLYTSALFAYRRRYARGCGHPWGILSAKYGFLKPDDSVRPYDKSMPTDLIAQAEWAESIFRHVKKIVDYDNHYLDLEVHAGIKYVQPLLRVASLAHPLVSVLHPVAGLGIGKQKAWYKKKHGPLSEEDLSYG